MDGSRTRRVALLALTLLTASRAGAQSCPLVLDGIASFPAVSEPRRVLLADLDGDGDDDAAVGGEDAVGIHLSDEGLLPQSGQLAIGARVTDLASSDLDLDGRMDLVVISDDPLSDEVLVFLGNGDGTFQAPAAHDATIVTGSLSVGDLQGDGIPDLVVTDTQNAALFRGRAGGAFDPPVVTAINFPSGESELGDLDQDGFLDLLVVGVGSGYRVSVYLNDGTGAFGAPIGYPSVDLTTDLRLGDVDGDGILDAVVGCQRNGMAVLRGLPGGALAPADWIGDYLTDTIEVELFDLDLDGDLDLLGIHAGQLSTYFNDGAGGFTASWPGSWSCSGGHAAGGDVDGDGARDLVLTCVDSIGVALWADGGLALGHDLQASGYGNVYVDDVIHAGDLDGDGTPDLAIRTSASPLFLLNAGDGRLADSGCVVPLPSGAPWTFASGDFDGDASPDIAISHRDVLVAAGDGEGCFALPTAHATTHDALGLVTADTDGDGDTDIVALLDYPGGYDTFLGNGDGTFAGPVHGGASFSHGLAAAVGDVDGDGLADVAVLPLSGTSVVVLRSNGDGTFASGIVNVGSQMRDLVAEDLDDDGLADLAVSVEDTNEVVVLRSTGGGGFQQIRIPARGGPRGIAAGDFDGDGTKDLAIASKTSGEVLLYRGDGSGAFTSAFALQSVGVEDVAAADFDGDGLADLATARMVVTHRSLGIGIAPRRLPAGTLGVAYAALVRGLHGTAPYGFVLVAGSLPPGLSIDAGGDVTGIPSMPGTFAATIEATDAAGCPGRADVVVTIGDPGFAPEGIVVGEGRGTGASNLVRAYRADGTFTGVAFEAYLSGKWGVNTSSGNLDGTPHEQTLTGPGPGPVYGPQVRVWDRYGTPNQKVNFYAYGTLKYGVLVAGGDVDGDGYDEILTGAGPGDVFGPHVRGFDYDGGPLSAIARIHFYAYGTLQYGVNVAAGSLDGDVPAEIVTGPGPGILFGPVVRGFNYDGQALGAIAKVNFAPYAGLFYGVDVGALEADGDGMAEIATAPGPGPAYPARFLGYDVDGGAVAPMPGFDVTLPDAHASGGHVGGGDVSGDGRDDLLASASGEARAGSMVRPYTYDGAALLPLRSFDAFPGSGYGANVVGSSNGL